MAAFVEQVVGHQALHRGLDRVIPGEGGDIVGQGVFGDTYANQLKGVAKVLRRQRQGRRYRPAQFNLPG
ncbi:hypothetical protein D3C76_1486820 [compost metagenome]